MNKKIWLFLITFLFLGLLVVVVNFFRIRSESYLLVFCDVGQGDAFFLQYKSKQLLVDGGPDNSILSCLTDHMPLFDKKIEMVVLTHPHNDHYAGLAEVLDHYKVEILMLPELERDSLGFMSFMQKIKRENSKVLFAYEGMYFNLWGIDMQIVHPDQGTLESVGDPNAASVVFYLTIKDMDILMTGDIGPGQADDLFYDGQLRPVEILKVPHQGSTNGLTRKMLDMTRPDIAVISVGEKNRFGHPHESILEMLEEKVNIIYRTDHDGDVVLRTDGKSITK